MGAADSKLKFFLYNGKNFICNVARKKPGLMVLVILNVLASKLSISRNQELVFG